MLVVDAANVVGSRPTGWWRDRAGAARSLVDSVRAAVAEGRLDPPVVVVLEGQARDGCAEGGSAGVRVVHAPGSGDDTMAALARSERDGGGAVTVVTADRDLRRRVEGSGGTVATPSWLLSRLAR